MRLGALEAGGTKMVCAIGNENGEILDRVVFPTEDPQETMPRLLSWFAGQKPDALGIASFGPLNLDRTSGQYGDITTTPKLAWKFFPLLRTFRETLGIPCSIDTDVNAAALAELRLGAARGLASCLYVTVGTGIGGGLVLENRLVHGLVHPEFGHILLRPDKDDPLPRGVCPYHDGCLEGLCSGPSLLARYGVPAEELPPDHPAWERESAYLAQMCVNAIMTLSVEKIILGGGVMQQGHLFPRIREKTRDLLGGYIHHQMVEEKMEDYIVPPALGTHSGITGALLIGSEALSEAR